MKYFFDWNHSKDKINRLKQGVSFEQASDIFYDSQSQTIYDDEHSEIEERWITMGLDKNNQLLVIIHTYQQIDKDSCKIRIISARKATKNEMKKYHEEYL